jgi:hypothetical protein
MNKKKKSIENEWEKERDMDDQKENFRIQA